MGSYRTTGWRVTVFSANKNHHRGPHCPAGDWDGTLKCGRDVACGVSLGRRRPEVAIGSDWRAPVCCAGWARTLVFMAHRLLARRWVSRLAIVNSQSGLVREAGQRETTCLGANILTQRQLGRLRITKLASPSPENKSIPTYHPHPSHRPKAYCPESFSHAFPVHPPGSVSHASSEHFLELLPHALSVSPQRDCRTVRSGERVWCGHLLDDHRVMHPGHAGVWLYNVVNVNLLVEPAFSIRIPWQPGHESSALAIITCTLTISRVGSTIMAKNTISPGTYKEGVKVAQPCSDKG